MLTFLNDNEKPRCKPFQAAAPSCRRRSFRSSRFAEHRAKARGLRHVSHACLLPRVRLSEDSGTQSRTGRRAGRARPDTKGMIMNTPHKQPHPKTPSSPSNTHSAKPEDFEKRTSPVRERMAKDIKETSPEERMKQGR